MSTPHVCPLCHGTGKQERDDGRGERVCHACYGRGIVWSPETDVTLIPDDKRVVMILPRTDDQVHD